VQDKPKGEFIKPQFIQVEACLYLGCERISQYSYSKPQIFGQSVDFNEDEIFFYAKDEAKCSHTIKSQVVSDRPRLMIQNLPSNTRLVLSIILLPASGGISTVKLPYRQGYIYGSVTMPLFDLNRRLK
jgi:hypothetical protein